VQGRGFRAGEAEDRRVRLRRGFRSALWREDLVNRFSMLVLFFVLVGGFGGFNFGN
jgi:hypothetical protein